VPSEPLSPQNGALARVETKPRLLGAVFAIGRDARADVGSSDLALLRSLKWTTRIAEAAARLAFLAGEGPVCWTLGVALLTYYFAVEAQLNHSIQHGAYMRIPGAGRFTPRRYETLAVPFQTRTWREAHRIHHAHPSMVGADPDTEHPLFRVHESVPRRAWHAMNAFVGAFFTFETWAFDYDAFLKRRGKRDARDRTELRKFGIYVAWHLLLFPMLAGPRWAWVLAGSLVAMILRNFIFTGLQTASSVGRRVSTLHAAIAARPRGDAFVRFQIETSKNFIVRGIWRVLVGGLDRHIEHHLFPDLPPNRLHALSARVREVSRENGVRYEEHGSFAESVRDSVGHLHQLSR
jgi:linoleoyl-CoA desaturase